MLIHSEGVQLTKMERFARLWRISHENGLFDPDILNVFSTFLHVVMLVREGWSNSQRGSCSQHPVFKLSQLAIVTHFFLSLRIFNCADISKRKSAF